VCVHAGVCISVFQWACVVMLRQVYLQNTSDRETNTDAHAVHVCEGEREKDTDAHSVHVREGGREQDTDTHSLHTHCMRVTHTHCVREGERKKKYKHILTCVCIY